MNPFDAAEATRPTSGARCGFCAKITTLTAKQRAMLEVALANEGYRRITIVTVLAEWGVKASENDIGRHRSFGITTDWCHLKFPAGRYKL